MNNSKFTDVPQQEFPSEENTFADYKEETPELILQQSEDILIESTSLDMLIKSSLKCIENIISESRSPNSFFKTLFSLAVNDCLVHLIVLDMCIDTNSVLSLRYIDTETSNTFRNTVALNAMRTPSITLGLLTVLAFKKKREDLKNYHGIYDRLYKYIVSCMRIENKINIAPDIQDSTKIQTRTKIEV